MLTENDYVRLTEEMLFDHVHKMRERGWWTPEDDEIDFDMAVDWYEFMWSDYTDDLSGTFEDLDDLLDNALLDYFQAWDDEDEGDKAIPYDELLKQWEQMSEYFITYSDRRDGDGGVQWGAGWYHADDKELKRLLDYFNREFYNVTWRKAE